MKIAMLGIDLGKNVCSVVGLDASGAVVLRRRVRRDTLIDLVAKLPACIVGMEACCGAHWPLIRSAGTRRSPDVTGVCAALCKGTKERRS
jgi:hypothetical protein